jgi:hypothetical protein
MMENVLLIAEEQKALLLNSLEEDFSDSNIVVVDEEFFSDLVWYAPEIRNVVNNYFSVACEEGWGYTNKTNVGVDEGLEQDFVWYILE